MFVKGGRQHWLESRIQEPPSVTDLRRLRSQQPQTSASRRLLRAPSAAGARRVKESFYRGFVLGFLLGVGTLLLSGHVH